MRYLYNSNEFKFAVSDKIPRNDVLRWLVFWYFSCGVEFVVVGPLASVVFVGPSEVLEWKTR